MKKFYLSMLFIALFSFNQTFGQSCPPSGFADNADQLVFVYLPGTSNCVDRPSLVTVEGSEFTLTTCNPLLSVYSLTAGPSLTDINNIAVDFGFDICEYSGGTLSAKEIEMIFKTMLKVYPNPVTQGTDLNIKFGLNISVRVSVYSVTGKQVLVTSSDNINNITLDISSLENGIYIAHIATDLATISRKIIVMK